MNSRRVEAGYMIQQQAQVYYDAKGEMVAYYSKPRAMVFQTNAKGDMTVYDPASNTVKQESHFQYSTETTHLYYFLQGKLADLGLKAMGFGLADTRFEGDLLITEWVGSPGAIKVGLAKVELVHRFNQPIFMGYYDNNGKVLKKVYYYKYTQLDGLDFPQHIVQIDYPTDGDSVLTKTAYSNILLNDAVDKSRLEVTIPKDARVIE